MPLTLALLGPFRIPLAIIGWIGGIIAFFHILFRGDLRLAQRILYIVLLLVPYWWLIYFLLGRKRTSEFLA